MSSIAYTVAPVNLTSSFGYNAQYLQLVFSPNTDLMLSLISYSFWMDNTILQNDQTSDLSFKVPCRVEIKYNSAPQTVITDLLLELNCVRVYKVADNKVYVNFSVILPNGIILPNATGGVVVRIITYTNTLAGMLDIPNSSRTGDCLFTRGGVGMMM